MADIPKIKGVKKIVAKEVIPFTRQLASMIGAGMPILTTMQTLEEQCDNPEFKKVLMHIRATIEGGEPMSRALSAFPKVFDDMYVNMVVAGEQSGEFAGILKRLAAILTSSSRLRKKVKSAMTYPTVIISIALIMSALLHSLPVPSGVQVASYSSAPAVQRPRVGGPAPLTAAASRPEAGVRACGRACSGRVRGKTYLQAAP